MRAAWVLQGLGYILLGFFIFYSIQEKNEPSQNPKPAFSNVTTAPMDDQTLLLRSPAFQNGQSIPSKYTCDGENISPPLAIENIPEKTVTLVLIMDDPDAPNSTWDHWVIFNIPKNTSRIGEGSTPQGTGGKNTWGKTGYGGPCPPQGVHRYFFRVYALNSSLRLDENATKNDVLEAMKGHILASSELLGTYTKI
jgi:Raf kinase inhibitor-like YbhB/YbcL family protein